MTRCPFALTTTCLLAGLTVALVSAGQDADVNKQVYRFLHHHVKSPRLKAIIEFAVVRGGAYYGTIVFLAHVVGYLVAVNLFDVSHAVAGKTLTLILVLMAVVGIVLGALWLARREPTAATNTHKRPISTTDTPPVATATTAAQ